MGQRTKGLIEVGRSSDGKVFIAVPPSRYDGARSPLTGTRKYLVLFTEPDIKWLIDALRDELAAGTSEHSPPLGQFHPTKPSVQQMLEAAPMLQWRKCHDCGHIGLHVENMIPWVNCRKCGSQDTRNLLDCTRQLQNQKGRQQSCTD